MTKQKLVSDQEGLSKAYASPIGLFSQGNTLYIAGSTTLAHVAEWWKIPAGMVKDSNIYKRALQYLRRRRRITRLVGHSYGGAAALELGRQNPKYTAVTYGAPVLDPIPRNPYYQPERYCNLFDPVCAADLGAAKRFHVSPFAPNPHSVRNSTPSLAKKFTSL
jgi:pimeloyl-ACP methyl ester carboxylesterase